MSVKDNLKRYQARVEGQLDDRLHCHSIEDTLQAAMRYSVFNGGKRIRPILIYLTNQALKGNLEDADSAACAIEAMHSYSLVHDDLPAMDDDNLRRGKPTCHIQYTESTAILAGDALQCTAFDWLSNDKNNLSAQRRLQMVGVLSRASGDLGMVAGQAFDLANVNKPLNIQQLESMHRCKTGALIIAAVELGIISANINVSAETYRSLIDYACAIGLAFQVQDDILDITGDTETLGKPQGSDQAANKPTYPALLGLTGAKQKLRALHLEAIDALQCLAKNGSELRELADYIVARNH